MRYQRGEGNVCKISFFFHCSNEFRAKGGKKPEILQLEILFYEIVLFCVLRARGLLTCLFRYSMQFSYPFPHIYLNLTVPQYKSTMLFTWASPKLNILQNRGRCIFWGWKVVMNEFRWKTNYDFFHSSRRKYNVFLMVKLGKFVILIAKEKSRFFPIREEDISVKVEKWRFWPYISLWISIPNK